MIHAILVPVLLCKSSVSPSACVCAQSLQSCLTFCSPMDCSTSGSSVHGIFLARILELPCPPSENLPYPGIEPTSPALQVDSLLLSCQESPLTFCTLLTKLTTDKHLIYIIACKGLLSKVFYCDLTREWNHFWIPSGGSDLPETLLLTVILASVQFSHSVVSDSLRSHELQHARPPCPSPTPRVHPNSHPSSRWCHPAISSSVVPFSSCPQSLPASESFPISQLFAWGGQSTGVSALASFLPKNTQDWSPLGWTGWISLQSKRL